MYFTGSGKDVTSYCDRTFPGWSHKTGVDPVDWACFVATKSNKEMNDQNTYERPESDLLTRLVEEMVFVLC